MLYSVWLHLVLWMTHSITANNVMLLRPLQYKALITAGYCVTWQHTIRLCFYQKINQIIVHRRTLNVTQACRLSLWNIFCLNLIQPTLDLWPQPTAGPRCSARATRRPTGSTSTATRSPWTCCARGWQISRRCTRRTLRWGPWAAVRTPLCFLSADRTLRPNPNSTPSPYPLPLQNKGEG